MAVTLYNNPSTLGTMENYEVIGNRNGAIVEEALIAVDAANDPMNYANPIDMLLRGMTKEWARRDGDQIPVEYFNVRFSQGKIDSDSENFTPYKQAFDTIKKDGWSLGLVSIQEGELDKAEEIAAGNPSGGNPIVARFGKSLEKAATTYSTRMRPYLMIQALLTGCSNRSTIPAVNTSGTFESQAGFLRGEEVGDFLLPTASTTTPHLFRAIKNSAGLDESDIKDALDILESFTDNMGSTYIGMGHTNAISDLPSIFKDTANQDMGIFKYVKATTILDVPFIGSNLLPRDFLFIMVEGKNDFLLHGVNILERQRGMVIKQGNSDFKFETNDAGSPVIIPANLDKTKAYIYPEEYYNFSRFSGCVIDINTSRSDANGLLTADGATALNDYITAIRKTFDLKSLRG